MPVTTTYPGVYIEEIPSGVRTITGVATSVTAFIGRALRGPVNQPVMIHSFGEFERTFGGLWASTPLSYAVRDFYQNGGSQALVVRLYKQQGQNSGLAVADLSAASPTVARRRAAAAAPSAAPLAIRAIDPGAWGNGLRITVDRDGIDADVAARYGLTPAALFNLTIRDTAPRGRSERIRNVSVVDGARRVDRVLAHESQLVAVSSLSPSPPDNTAAPVSAVGGSDGASLTPADYQGSAANKTGFHALDKADLFNLMCVPPDQRGGDTAPAVYQAAMAYCAHRRAVLLVDPPTAWTLNPDHAAANAVADLHSLGLSGPDARNAALFFPQLLAPDPLRENQLERFVPSGAVAGVISRTDATRGVWKAPAGLDAGITGIQSLDVSLTDAENGMLNPLGVNCLRTFVPGGTVVWGARTRRGADQLADEYKYLSVRRLALFIEESLYRGTQWVVFEENAAPLWAQIRLNLTAFMQTLFRQGAFQGSSPREAYFVRCDGDTTTQDDINRGVVNIVVGFAPLKPAEFVVIQIQQIAGDVA
jgi:phage tail sheath protein FI